MIKLILKITAIVFAVILQFVLMPILSIQGNFPNLILVGALVLIILDYENDAFWVAALGGILIDLGSPYIFGLNTLLFVGLVFLIRILLKKYIPQVNSLILMLIIFLSTLVYSFIIIVFLKYQLTFEIFLEPAMAVVLATIFFFTLMALNKPNQVVKLEKI